MSVLVRQKAKKWELRVKHRLLEKPFYATMDSEIEAREYGGKLAALLDKGIIPAGIVREPTVQDQLLGAVIQAHLGAAPAPAATAALLTVLAGELKRVRMTQVTYKWAENWVAEMKRGRRLAPGSIRKRVSALAICLDAHHRRAGRNWANPLRMLPRGYATYGVDDVAQLASQGLEGRAERARDRRLRPGEEDAILAALAGQKRPDRERPLKPDPALVLLFRVLVDTGVRLREAYTLTCAQVDLARGTLNVAGTKGSGARQVPLKPALRAQLAAYLTDRVGVLFPFWSGRPEDLDKTTSKLSRQFGRVFEYAGCDGLTEHDLRHEATCRWVELRDARGGWVFSDTEVCRIMGWSKTDMLMRYASLRGSDLAARLI